MSTHENRPDDAKAVLVRSTTYRDACTNPMNFPTGDSTYKNQIHHILCEHSIGNIDPQNDTDGKKYQYIMDCLWTVAWNINDAPNLIGLPMMSAYVENHGKIPQNFPAHSRDHPAYTQECKQWLHDNIWDRLIWTKKNHKSNTTAILKLLQKCTGYFEALLLERALRPEGMGTEHAYNNQMEPFWYAAFSMAEEPIERAPFANYLKSSKLGNIGKKSTGG